MEILHTSTETDGKFYISGDDGEEIAVLAYRRTGNELTLDRTETDPSLRGQGVAGKLLGEAVAYVRENDFKVMPVCSYVVRKFDNAPDVYGDIDARL